MYVFILAIYLGLNPNLGNNPTFTYLKQHNSPKEREDHRVEFIKQVEKEEDKKRVGCIILYIPPKEKEV